MTGQKTKILDIMKKSGILDSSFCSLLPLLPFLIDCRAKQRLPKNGKTVITCIFPYKVFDNPPLNISRYATVPDYHKILIKYLKKAADMLKNEYPENEFVPFIDNSPIPEVMAGVISGLGVKGDNGLLINEKYGSYVFIGEIVTDLEIECENNYKECMHCGKCREKCPKSEGIECLSAVTQKKTELSEKEMLLIKKYNTVWGCDICSEVCPLNRNKIPTYIKEFKENYRNEYTYDENILGRAYEWRGEKVIKRNYNL